MFKEFDRISKIACDVEIIQFLEHLTTLYLIELDPYFQFLKNELCHTFFHCPFFKT